MKKLLGLAAGLTLAGFAAPGLAQAQNAYTTEFVNLRAGPGLEYPVVFEVAQGQPLESYGCLDGWSWCDVSINGYRGWVAGEFIAYAGDGGGYVPLYVYGPRFHLPIISFEFGSYWDHWYRDRPWYRDRDHWAAYDWHRHAWNGSGEWNGRHDFDRWNGGNWNRHSDNDRHDGNRRSDGDHHDGNSNGNGNGRNTFHTDNKDRRPGSPVHNNTAFGTNDPSVHSGNTSNHDDGNRLGNGKNWGNSSYRAGVNTNPQFKGPQNGSQVDGSNGHNNDRVVTPRSTNTDRANVDRAGRFEQHNTNQVTTPVSTKVDTQPRGNTDHANQNGGKNNGAQNNGGQNNDHQNSKSTKNDNGKNDKHDRNDPNGRN